MKHASWCKQRGMTAIGWLVMLLIFGFFVLLVLKLGPVYLDHYNVKMAVESVSKEPGAADSPQQEIMKKIRARLDINYVTDLPKDAIRIRRGDGEAKLIDVIYERRVSIAGNVDAVVAFKEQVVLHP
jgi:hypothetical protein